MSGSGGAGRQAPPSRRGVGETFRRPDTAPLRPVTRGDEGSERGFYSDILGTHEQHEAGDSGTQGYLQLFMTGPGSTSWSVRTVGQTTGHIPAVTAVKTQSARDKDVHKAGPPPPPKSDLPRKAFQPKVQLAYEVPSGTVPRRVKVERHRREFSDQNLAAILAETHGLDLVRLLPVGDLKTGNSISSSEAYLPLEQFDNTDLDDRPPEEWVEIGMDANGVVVGTPARTLRPITEDPFYGWVNCVVKAYDAETGRFTVVPDGQSEVTVPRIALLFLSEDPQKFATRLAGACAARSEAEQHLRYNLIVDCMPTDTVGAFDPTRLADLLQQSTDSTQFNDANHPFVQELLLEINLAHARAYNKQMLNTFIAKDPDAFPGVLVPPPPTEIGPRESIGLQKYNYAKLSETIRAVSFQNHPDVMRAIQQLKLACAPAEAMLLFSTALSKPMTLSEFESAQLSVYDGVKGYLRNSWIPGSIKAIQSTIGKIARGWFDMHTMTQDVYDVSRLRMFYTMVKLMMQDTLRSIAVNSCTAFANMISTASSTLMKAEVRVWPADAGLYSEVFKAPTNPLFSLSLVIEDGTVQLSTPVDPFVEAILHVLFNGLDATSGLHDIEPLLMPDLFWVGEPKLQTAERDEPWLVKLREQIKTCIEAHIEPVQSYIAMYSQYTELIQLDKDVYLEEFMSEDRDAVAIRNECNKHLKAQQEIEAAVPNSVVIGLFHLNTATCRDILTAKCKAMSATLLQHLGQTLRKAADSVLHGYNDIANRLRAASDGIEALDEKQNWINHELNDSLAALRKLGDKALADWDILEEFKIEMPDEDFDVRWMTYGWPKKMQEIQAQADERMAEDRERFKHNLIQNVQEFAQKINHLQKTVAGFYCHDDLEKTEQVAVEVRKLVSALSEAQKDAQTYNIRQRIFDMPVTDYSNLGKCVREFEPYKQLWLTTDDWIKSHKVWMNDPLGELDAEALELQIAASAKAIFKCTKAFKDVPGCLQVAETVTGWIREFQPFVPLIQALRNPGMRDRHWDQLSEKLGFEVKPNKDFTFTNCLEKQLQNHIDVIVKVGEFAGKEFAIETALDKMEAEWRPIDLTVMAYKETGTYIISGVDEIIQQLDDHIVMTQAMSFSPYKKPFEDRIAIWERKLLTSSDVIEEWLKVQQLWLYLEPIFSSDDIARQLPTENKRYQTMYTMWRKAMKGAFKTPNVITYCPNVKLLEDLRESNKLLEQVSKGLSSYLESKRGVFARFYFLSDDELLEILSQTKNPLAVQPHMRKCFDNIKSLTFEDDLQMSAFSSEDGETVKFNEILYPKGNVENWLLDVERVMQLSIKEIFTKAWAAYYESDRVDWVSRQGWPGQIVIAGTQMAWTKETSEAIDNGEMPQHTEKSKKQLADLVVAIRGKLDKIARKVISALIVIEVHAKDVCISLRDDGIKSSREFEWIKQLRYYWEQDDEGVENLRVKSVTAAFNYGYEYLGNSGRLVITPLTDRIYITLTGALELVYGGAPAGPAGTGKTETTKDLAKALAIQCVVFNCSDQLDYRAMAKFFKGLASAGAWACFDEFNRIDIEVLSVVAQQVLTIQLAIKAKERRFFFEGSDLQLRWTAAPFITMNPGYAGRTELPDNLAALFRPVACMVPDYTMIAEIFLYSYGFEDAKELSGKVTTVFKLSSEQLSSQDHYDFGMRAVKTVIVAAGNLKRTQGDVMSEDQIVLSAMTDVNEPKFLQADLLLFKGIVSDLFPTTEKKEVDYSSFKEAISKSCEKVNMQPVEGFVTKVIQLYETTVVRHGLMLVGPAGSGKTKDYEILASAITDMSIAGVNDSSGNPFTKVDAFVLNPKSITMGQLYGSFDPLTLEWTDGILSTLVRRGVAADDAVKKWFIFDGPVDAIWIENMNTVLDDNKKLCLASGEIIALTSVMTMMFEVEDLTVASPATVSRCGMVYLEPGIFGERPLLPFIDTWFETQVPDVVFEKAESKLRLLFEMYLEAAIEFVRLNCREMNKSVDSNLCFSMLKLLRCFFEPFETKEDRQLPEEVVEFLPNWVEYWFFFSLIWSVGASCYEDGRSKFDTWLRNTMKQAGSPVLFPDELTVYDYCMVDDGARAAGNDEDDEEEKHEPKTGWRLWSDTFTVPTVDPLMPFSKMIIPTVDAVRTIYVMEKLITYSNPVLVIGPTGSGKSVNMTNKLLTGMPREFVANFLMFSAKTSANQTQDMIDMKLDKRRKGVYGPPIGKKAIIFVDDLNMPMKETYGAQPPLELLRQFMDHEGWYDRTDIGAFRSITDVTLLGAMGPPGGGRNFVSDRLLRHFNFLALPDLSNESRRTIFNPILSAFFGIVDHADSDLATAMVNATIDIFNKVVTKLLPTPAKVHYTFNLRDLAKVFGGILMCDPKSLEDRECVIRLWMHETQRVFRDRLINAEDCDWFDNLVNERIVEDLKTELTAIRREDEVVLYGDFMDSSADPRKYVELPQMGKVKQIMDEALDDYNQTNTTKMRLVLFDDAMQHATKISRIIRQPMGNALLLGVGGSGRQSMTRLAAYMADFECFQIELSKNYGIPEWREDLKKMMKKGGLEDKSVVFLFSDTQIKSESFLEDINNILNAGDVPGIYEAPEMDQIYQAMKPIVQAEGQIPTKSAMFAAYCSRVRQNVHTVMCMSPIGDVFRARLRQFPALVNCCTIDWFSPWPDEALRSVATTILNDIPNFDDPEVIRKVTDMCTFIHQSAVTGSAEFKLELGRVNYITPTAYLSLLEIFGAMINDKRKSLQDDRQKTAIGMDKLETTEKEVIILQAELEEMQPALKIAKKETEEAMVVIAANKKEAEVTAIAVGKEETEANEKKEKTEAIAADAQRDLDEALPALDQAVASLKSLKVSDITELKAFKNPPGGVKMVMEGVCIMKGVKPKRVNGDKPGEKIDDYWSVATPLLGNPKQFLDSLFEYDKENIPESVIAKIKPYIADPKFQPSEIKKVSEACTAICCWVRAMDKYYHVSRMVEPKRKALAEAQTSLEITMKALNEAKAKLADVTSSIEAMETDLKAKADKKKELEDKAEECAAKLIRAEKLIGGLGGEKVRWAQSIEKADKLLVNVVGDIVLSAGTVAYLGPFTEQFRSRLTTKWMTHEKDLDLPYSSGATPTTTLSNAVEIRKWQISGLPNDEMSTENAVIVKYSERWPLFIDPQSQANNWVRTMEGDKLVTMKLSDRDFLRSLENAVRFGSPCLLENILEELDPALEPILLQQTFKQAGGLVIKLGDNVVPYHEDFKFYLTTKLPNPHYTPEVSTKATVINFTLAPTGLENQMLGLVVATERPDLEEQKNELIVSNARMKAEMKELEELILKLLSECEGSPVDDVDLIQALEDSKIKSDDIAEKMAVAEETEAVIDETRTKYVPVAIRTQLLFFCTGSLANVDPMYQYSLDWFRHLFVRALEQSEKSDDLNTRIENINTYFTFSLYSNVCRSLFERHKLLFSFLLCITILKNQGEIDDEEWRFLITGGTITPEELPNPAPSWISERAWKEILTLPALPKFAQFAKEFESNVESWKKIFDSPNPHREQFPGDWQASLDSFQKLLVMRSLRYDKLTEMMQDFVSDKIGQQFLEPQTANLSQIFPESNPSTPLIFVLSAGTDPAADLLKFAEEMKMTKKLQTISLGQGQGPKAQAMMEQGLERGGWVFFQNCHLAPSWMPSLERMIENIDPSKVHRDFRLWLTSMPSPKFPVAVLQNGSKMTVEPPRGIKATLMGCFDALDDDALAHEKESFHKSLLFSLLIFHGVLLERRKYGPLGFNIPYAYTQSDLEICKTQLRMFLDSYETPPFKVLVYTAGHINYGGRVTDDWDRRFQLTMLSEFYKEEVVSEGFKFSPSGVYTQPAVTDKEGYLEYVRTRPINDEPEMFGLHSNANITYSNNETDALLGSILNAGGGGGGGGGSVAERDRALDVLTKEIQTRIAKPFDTRAISAAYPVLYEESMNTVLQQEAIRFNKLISVIHSSLDELRRALQGFVVMSADLEAAANAMFNNQVPAIWTAKAYPSLKPLASWVNDLVERIGFMQKWIDEGVPAAFWISGFYFPQAFLTGTLQNYSRKQKIPIDTLSFDFHVMKKDVKEIYARPSEGCYIYGLFLEGARWSKKDHELQESVDKELFMQMSPMKLQPVAKRVKPTTGIYTIPCYKTLRRAGVLSTTGHSTNFVLALEIPSNRDESHWIKRGVALFCALNY